MLKTFLLTDFLSLSSFQRVRNSTYNALGSSWTNGPPIIRMIKWISQTRYTEKTKTGETPKPRSKPSSALSICMTSTQLAQTRGHPGISCCQAFPCHSSDDHSWTSLWVASQPSLSAPVRPASLSLAQREACDPGLSESAHHTTSSWTW